MRSLEREMKKVCFLFMLFTIAFNYGQDETANWYFGNRAGIRFNKDGSVTTLNDGKINTVEGCASISDKNGSLLFYTDGITVYNSNHTQMQNGTGLYGDPSSTQSALIVPAPASDVLFYIFTVDTAIEEFDTDFGLNYSIVDISKNEGNGAITAKNINLLQSCSEKITAVVKDCSEESVWVMTLSTRDGKDGLSDTFHAFEVTKDGINKTAVKSTFNTTFSDQRGYLKFSSDGKRMASANELDGLFLYNFNPQTGVISNPERIMITAPNKNPYSVEFSPNNQFLYVHTHSDAPAMEVGHNSNLLQYDLLSNSISESEQILDQNNIYRGALQLGANGKIYRTVTKTYLEGTSYLGVINNPNAKGTAANYQHNAIYLNNGIAMQGLPPFIQSFFAKRGLIKTPDGTTSTAATFCSGNTLLLETDEITGATYSWEHNGIPISSATSNNLQIDAIDEADAGQYRLTISQADATQCNIIGEAQIKITDPPIANNTRLTQCDIDEGVGLSTDGFTTFNLEQAVENINPDPKNTVTFYRSLADQENNIPIENITEYINETAVNQVLFVKINDVNGCSNETELSLEVIPSTSPLTTTQTYYTCEIDPLTTKAEGVFNLQSIKEIDYDGFDVAFYHSKRDASLETNAILEKSYTSVTTTLYARIESMNQCLGVEALQLVVNPSPIVNLDSEFLICTNAPSLSINAEQGFDNYAWYKLETTDTETLISNKSSVTIVTPGEYRLEISLSYTGENICTASKTFKVLPSNNAVISNIEIEDLQENNRINIIAVGDGDYEYAIEHINGPYQNSANFENIAPGTISIYVRDKNGCGITEEKVSIIGFPKFFTPNGDGINESWNLIGIPNNKAVTVNIYDRYGKLVHQINQNNSAGWNGTFNGKLLPASDYWFKVNIEEERTYQGHFTLKR